MRVQEEKMNAQVRSKKIQNIHSIAVPRKSKKARNLSGKSSAAAGTVVTALPSPAASAQSGSFAAHHTTHNTASSNNIVSAKSAAFPATHNAHTPHTLEHARGPAAVAAAGANHQSGSRLLVAIS